MRAEIKEKNGRKVYERKGGGFREELILAVVAFAVGVILTLMFYPIIRAKYWR